MFHDPLPPCSVIGIVGGGQLGRMLAMAAASLGYHAHIFTEDTDSPAAEVAAFTTVAAYEDTDALQRFAESVQVITVEFENIPASTAHFLHELRPFYPSPSLFAICRDRGKEKAFARECGVATAAYQLARSAAALQDAVQQIGTPCIVKSTTMGYDGKGQVRLHQTSEAAQAWERLHTEEVIIEAFVPFVAEASVIVARDQSGTALTFPVTRNEHEGGILRRSVVPCGLSEETIRTIEQSALRIAERANLIGLLAIEWFVLEDGSVLLNEMAPRPHNSGHWTMDGCSVSQFEQLVRICAGIRMKQPRITQPIEMLNVIGNDMDRLSFWQQDETSIIHLYGKQECRAGRKMGHINRFMEAYSALK